MQGLTPTWQDLSTALAVRLDDPAGVRWTADERHRYLNEALRTWNSFTSSFRQRAVAVTVSGQAFYDLPSLIPTLRAPTVTDREIVTDCTDALLEPPITTWSTWPGTDQFTLAQLTSALQRRQDQFLRETGIILTYQEHVIVPVASGRTLIPADILTIRRAAWESADGTITALGRDDDWGLDHYRREYVQQPQRPPRVYATSTTPPLQIQVAPVPLDAGQLDLLVVLRGETLTPDVDVSILPLPDDWTWVLKWGVLADVLSQDGLAFDSQRAQYCDARWKHGIAAARNASVLLSGAINDVRVSLTSVADLDQWLPTWQGTAGAPTRLMTAGQTILAASPVPDGVYGITCDVVRNAPVTLNMLDPFPVDVSSVDILLDYAQHLALFKEGPGQLILAQPLAERFFAACGVLVDLQQAEQPARAPLMQQTTQNARVQPDRLSAVEMTLP